LCTLFSCLNFTDRIFTLKCQTLSKILFILFSGILFWRNFKQGNRTGPVRQETGPVNRILDRTGCRAQISCTGSKILFRRSKIRICRVASFFFRTFLLTKWSFYHFDKRCFLLGFLLINDSLNKIEARKLLRNTFSAFLAFFLRFFNFFRSDFAWNSNRLLCPESGAPDMLNKIIKTKNHLKHFYWNNKHILKQ